MILSLATRVDETHGELFFDMAEIDEQYLEDFNNMSLRRVGGLDVNALVGRKHI